MGCWGLAGKRQGPWERGQSPGPARGRVGSQLGGGFGAGGGRSLGLGMWVEKSVWGLRSWGRAEPREAGAAGGTPQAPHTICQPGSHCRRPRAQDPAGGGRSTQGSSRQVVVTRPRAMSTRDGRQRRSPALQGLASGTVHSGGSAPWLQLHTHHSPSPAGARRSGCSGLWFCGPNPNSLVA